MTLADITRIASARIEDPAPAPSRYTLCRACPAAAPSVSPNRIRCSKHMVSRQLEANTGCHWAPMFVANDAGAPQ
jgi:hypothetical protein